ncbi:Bystin-domain-containing protein [Hyaloraphidium curvatum]|nr:Bystin-domain-containing protein [Hyaloraphidium curvatum]
MPSPAAAKPARAKPSFAVARSHPYRKSLGQKAGPAAKMRPGKGGPRKAGPKGRTAGRTDGGGQKPTKDTEMDSGASDEEEDEDMGAKGSGFVDARTSKRILDIARLQQEEIDAEDGAPGDTRRAAPARPSRPDSDDEGSGGSDFDAENFDEDAGFDDDDFAAFRDGFAADVELDDAERRLIEKFIAPSSKQQRNLADIIMDRIKQAEEAPAEALEPAGQQAAQAAPAPLMVQGPKGHMLHVPPGMNPKVVEVYSKVGLLLSRYRSGKLPKPFKIIPSFKNWDEILYLTRPEDWTPHATYQATRIFVSNLKGNMAQRFFELVLLDRVRDDIAENKKLNVHLYLALKKALYKPAAFFKGILLPLLESGNCTLREAAIIGSVVSKVSIPVLHSSAALLKVAELPYTGPSSLFVRILLDKKYALPYRVVDALVFHFLRFKQDKRQLPVLWQQSLLVFSQRYKEDMTPDQKDALLEVVKVHFHPTISPEIRRELGSSSSRMEE